MGTVAVVDCFSGASGDMLLGALFDAGVDLEQVRSGLQTLPITGWRLTAEPAQQHGIRGTRAKVDLEQHDQPHRGLAEVLRIIHGGRLPPEAIERATHVFTALAEVEASIHGTSTEEVEFHEVGAIDAIVDIVGVVLGFHLLGVEHISCEGLPLGSGWVRAAHGKLSVPAPATLELLKRAGLPIRRNPSEGDTGELTTPTGAALVTQLAEPGGAPIHTVQRVGYGFGSREPAWPNAVRLILGDTQANLLSDSVVEIMTNLDDSSPEELGFAMERLLEAGALDVAFSPLQMKKNRPGVLLRVLARPVDAQRLAELMLEHTSALGVRLQTIERRIARRLERTVATPWGDVRVKVKVLGTHEVVAPEFEDCARVARENGIPLRDVYAAAKGLLA